MRAALIDRRSVVDNVILLDADSDFEAPEGFRLVILDPKDAVQAGDTWANGVWIPKQTNPVEPAKSLEDQLAELKATVEMLLINALEG